MAESVAEHPKYDIKSTCDDQPFPQYTDLHSVTSTDVGHVTNQQEPFTVWSTLSLGYSITNTGGAMLLVVGNSVFGAGPLFLYGTLLITAISFCVAITLGELASAYPHAGGQYFWVAQLSSKKHQCLLSYMTATISWASVVCIGASTASAAANITFQMVVLTHPDFAFKQWMEFLAFQGYNIAAAFASLHEKVLPKLSKGFFIMSLTTLIASFICLLASDNEEQTAAAVFGADTYFNLSGWPDGVAFMIGLSGINWGFSCLDAVTHLAEEMPQPRKNIPVALLSTVGIGLVTGIIINLAIFFVAVDLPNTTSILALLHTLYHGNPVCAYTIGSMILITVFNSIIGIHVWQARIAWSLSPDKGFSFHSHLSKIAPAPFYTTLWAHFWSVGWISLCGFLYLVSLTAFNSFISAGIVLQYMTYAMPAVLLLIHGRNNLHHGPFWWPRFGPVANVIVITWTLVTMVIYSFPLFLPVEAGSMNYLSCVLVAVFLFAGAYWIVYGSKHYRLVDLQTTLG